MESGEEELWQSEVLVSDSIGRLIEFWGFKRNMGRLWGILYLSDRPLSAPEIQSRLQLSSGAVSMTLNELTRWGVVKKVWLQGERRDHYAAEGNFWKMISRVFIERERVEVSVEVTRRALLVVSDTWMPEWRARVDGAEREILPVNLIFRGVVLEPGDQNVVMTYEPASFRSGLTWSSFSALAICALLVAVLLPRRRRATVTAE